MWHAACTEFLADKVHTRFPQPPHLGCPEQDCNRRLQDWSNPLRTCPHSMERLLQSRPRATDSPAVHAPESTSSFIRRFRLHWHPDRFSADGVRGTAKQAAAEELWKVLDGLLQ